MEKNVKKTVVIPLIITIVVIGILYYVTIPPINIRSVQFWNFLIWYLIITSVLSVIQWMIERHFSKGRSRSTPAAEETLAAEGVSA